MAESAAYSLTQRSARTSTRWAVPYKVSIYLSKKYANLVMRNTHTLSLHIFFGHLTWPQESCFQDTVSAANLTVSMSQRGSCRLIIDCSRPHNYRITVCVYHRFSFSHFLNLYPQSPLKYEHISFAQQRSCNNYRSKSNNYPSVIGFVCSPNS